MKTAPRSLQGHLLKLVLGLVVAVWLITAALTWWDARHELDELLDSHLAQAAALLVVQQANTPDDEHSVDAPSLHRYAPKVAFQVFHEGQLTLRSANAPLKAMTRRNQGFQSGFDTVELDGHSWRVFATFGAEHDVQVYVGEAQQSRDSILWAVLRSTLWPMLVVLPILALAIWWAVYRGMAPLRRLGQTLAERLPQDLHPVDLDDASSEMAPMVHALNELLARIATLLEGERRFTADAAHELRTPIAAIRAQAQVALAESDDALRRHALRNTLEGCDRATRLVEQLLTLSRLEAGDALSTASLDLRPLVQGVVAELAPQALGKKQDLSLEAPQPCVVQGNDILLAVLVRNLVDNAIRYSPSGATVQVTLDADTQGTVLQVCDSGPGLDDADRARLGTRFFRVPGSAQSGSGLGWSIVHRIAAVHHAKLQVGPSAKLGGLAVTLHLPLVPRMVTMA